MLLNITFAGRPPIWIPICFPLFFIAVWIFVLFLTSRVGGWSTLAQYYRTDRPFPGTIFRWQGAQLRYGTNYNGCLTFGADEEGLYIVPVTILRAFHSPLLFPWNEIESRPVKVWLFFNFVELRFLRAPGVPMKIPVSLADRIAASSAGRFGGALSVRGI